MTSTLKPHLWKFALAIGFIILMVIAGRRYLNSSAEPSQVATKPEPALSAATAPQQTVVQTLQTTPTQQLDSNATANPISTPTETATPVPVYHIVQAGEAPITIAQSYGISVDVLLEINQITDPTLLQIGQQLIVPVTVTPTPAATPTPRESPTPTPEPIIYTVQAGDTLSGIAAEYDVSLGLILFANEIDDSQSLRVGQELVIPQSEVSFDTPMVVHVIESGDTFGRLAFLYGSTIDDIVAANPTLNPNTLRVGQQVIVPVTDPPLNPHANPRLPQITAPEAMPSNLVPLQQQIIDGTNQQRQANGLPPLLADDELAVIALAHAQDMVKRGYFAHVTPEGIDLRTRFEQHGVSANWVGENIQRNTKPQDETAAEAIRWFMNSAPHRANILHDRFNSIGVGVVEEPEGWYTFVLVFAEQ